ncbi:MAG: amidohydrolase [Bacteroidales bacterium]|nr:amidohydrolase [Bacteroidota bacterium]MBL6949519.1 amidohydrolase [Bacteroidales bacterium]
MRQLSFLVFLSTLLLTNSCTMKKHVETIVYNAKIYTMDESKPTIEAFVIDRGKVIETGVKEALLATYSPKNQLDAEGLTIFPGFIDAHCHFYGLALGLKWIDLVGCSSFDEVIERIGNTDSIEQATWITGRGWDQNLWRKKVFPSKERLDALYPDQPVVLVRIDGHAVLANQTALDIAGITTNHIFSEGEVEIINGKLTGILSENAADHLRRIIPKPDENQAIELIKQAEEQCFSFGLTGVADAGLENRTLKLLDSVTQQEVIKIHIYAMIEPSPENIDDFMTKGPYITDRFHICSVKLYADGSLGSRTALLKQPYSDDPSKIGIQVTSPDSIREICQLAYDNGFQVNTHCIGDSATRVLLDIYGEYLKGDNDRRWRIEHAQVVDPADLILFEKHSIIPSIQATHTTSDMYWAGERLGPIRIQWAYAYRDLLNQNGWLANGTDFPIERISPLLTFYASVARQDEEGYPAGGFQIENGLTREEALKSITIWAAKANFDEHDYGSLEPGKWADFVILDKDIMEIPLSEIPDVKVLKTFSHGEQVYGMMKQK